jgi:hypothetical protein
MQGVQEHSTCARRRCGYADLQGDGGPDDVPVKQSRFAEHCSTSQQWSVTGAGGGSVCSRLGTGGADVRFMPRAGPQN